MKREDVKAHIPNITDEAMAWILDTTGAELTREKNKAADLQKQLDAANTQLSEVQEKLKAFDGVDVAQLKGESDKLRQQIADMKDGWAFDTALDGAIRDAKGRNLKAIRGMLDLDALKASKDRSADIKAAIEGLVKENPWAFETAPSGSEGGAGGKPSATFSTGGEHGTNGDRCLRQKQGAVSGAALRFLQAPAVVRRSARGNGGDAGPADGVAAAFAALNPDLKL